MTKVESIAVAPSVERTTTPGRFEAALTGAARALAASVAGAVELAAPAVPFGTVLAGAVRGAAAPSPFPGAAGGDTGSAAAGGGDIVAATRALQREAQAWNLQYLQLQERLQRESREFTAISNVMKVKHDSARAAITNIH
jgi:hypothetical protein